MLDELDNVEDDEEAFDGTKWRPSCVQEGVVFKSALV
jgi:hypothetical protein